MPVIFRPAFLLFCTVLFCSTGTVSAQVADNHGNTIPTATTITLNTSVSGTIAPADDIDYFSLVITEPTSVEIFTTGDLIAAGDLLDSMNKILAQESSEFDNLLFREDIEPGTYYISVFSRGANKSGDYVLYVLTQDHGHTTTTATTFLELDTSESGTITHPGSSDYFSIEIMDTQTSVEIFTTGDLNTVGRLIDGRSMEVTSDDDSGVADNFLIRARIDPGTYYIEVSGNPTIPADYVLYVYETDELVPQISLTIPSALAESTNEVIGSTMIAVKHGEPFPVYINVTAFENAGILTLTLDGPQNAALPTMLTVPVLDSGDIWTEFYLGYGPSEGTGEASYRYCQSGTQNCSSSILVSYSLPAAPVVNVEDRYGAEWDFTLSDQTVTNTNICPGDLGTFPTLLSQRGNMFTSTGETEYTGIVNGGSYSLAYHDSNLNGGTYIDTLVTQHSPDPVALSGAGVWWWTNKAGFLCSGTYNIRYTPRSSIDSITVGRTSVSEDVGNVAVTITLTQPPVQPVVAMLEIEGTATDADYAVERNINFGIGEKQTTLNLVIVDDSRVELDETIILRVVSQDSNKLVGESSTTLTIEDNDVLVISFEQAEYTIFEGTTVTVTLAADQPLVVETQIELTTLAETTLPNTAYRFTTTIVTFKPDQSTASFEVPIFDDSDLQTTRELHLSFELPDNNAIHGATSETVIRVKDSRVPIASLEIVGREDDINILLEKGNSVTLQVTLDRTFDQDTSITITTAGTATQGATQGDDYTISINPVEFEMGSTSAETVLSVNPDSESETDETIILSLDAESNLIIDDGLGAQLTLTIEKRTNLLFRIKVFLEGAQ